MLSIVSDDEVYAQFKDDSRKQYSRMWSEFRPPGKEALVGFF